MANTGAATRMTAVMNTIRYNATDMYKSYVPAATSANITDVGNPILNYQSVKNEFLNALVNKVARTIVSNKLYNNPLAPLKKGKVPLGMDIEDIYTNPAQATAYNMSETSDILKIEKPDTKAAYYRMNRRDKYKATIFNQNLRTAFTSWDSLESFLASIVNSLYSGNNIDEFGLTKKLLSDAYGSGYITAIETDAVTSDATGKLFMKALKTVSANMKFPSSNYNRYKEIAVAQGITDATAVTTWTEPEDQILLIRADVAASIGVESLAAAFQLSQIDYPTRVIEVDAFPNKDIFAFLVDAGIFQIYDNLEEFTEFYNAGVLSWTYYWHVWQTYAIRPYANAVAIVNKTASEFVAVTDVTVSPLTGTVNIPLTLTGTVTPDTATNTAVTYSTEDTDATISGSAITCTKAKTVAVTATVKNGATSSTDYTKSVNIVFIEG